MIDHQHALPIKRQAELVGISRGTVYYLAAPTDPSELALMRRLDRLHLAHPFMGARMLRDTLNRERDDAGALLPQVGRKYVTTLMRRMGITALYQKPGTSTKHPGHTIYPYLLRGIKVAHSNQAWALDTTYIPMAQGFVYLTAVVDIASRRALAWRVAITLEACHAVEALEQAFSRYGTPEIVNTDQGSQFTASEFTAAVLGRGCKLSMDGRGAWRDNVFVERLWRTVKYEEVYLYAYDSASAARAGIDRHLNWYNDERPHSSLDKQTPNEAYAALLPTVKLAA
jgi:putative transposase